MAKKKLPYMQFYPKAYLADTRRLSCLEHGLYCQLLFLMWESRGVLHWDSEALAYETGLTIEQFNDAWKAVSRFFFIKKNRLYNQRILDDLAEKKEISEKRKNSVGVRWSENNNKNNEIENTNVLQNDTNKEPKPKPKDIDKSISKEKVKKENYLQDFEEFWKAYPHKVGRKANIPIFQKCREQYSQQQIMDGLERYIKSKPPDRAWCNPSTFLNQERFNDEPDNPIQTATNNNRRQAIQSSPRPKTAIDFIAERAARLYGNDG